MDVETASLSNATLNNNDQVVHPQHSNTTLRDEEEADDYVKTAQRLSRIMEDPESVRQLEELSRDLSSTTFSDILRQGNRLSVVNGELADILQSAFRRMDSEGTQLSHTGVSFANLCTRGVANEQAQDSSFSAFAKSICKLPFGAGKQVRGKNIITGVDGLIEAGEMLLVLGRPGAGCSTFLKTLAGETDHFLEISGNILYDGVAQEDMLRYFKPDVIYNGEDDIHFPHLTVEQTLKFAIASKTPKARADGETRKQYQVDLLKLLSTVFGISHTYNTKVGSSFVRGVSGGERKRVSIVEALAARGSVYFFDNATRGLDASTALEYANALRTSTNILRNVAVVALYQASDNIYDKFDKVTILYSGRQIYFGRSQDAKRYFEDMGFECPSRQTTAEFLTAITDPTARFPRPGMEQYVPQTAAEFVEYWKQSREYIALVEEREIYNQKMNKESTLKRFRQVRSREKMSHQRLNSQYLITYPAQLKLAIVRGFQRVRGNMAYYIFRVVGALIQALISGSLFYNTPNDTNGVRSRSGVLFFSLLFNALTALAEVSMSFEHRPIILKHKSYSFAHPSTEALQRFVTDLPVRVGVVAVFSVIMYFLSNLRHDAGAFFIFYVFLQIAAFCLAAFFQMVAAACASDAPANSVAGVGVVILCIYAGFLIPTTSMHPWFKWISYINPVAYAFEAVMSNEFHTREMDCDTLVPSGPSYPNVKPENQVCAFAGALPGQSFVSGDEYIKVSYNYSYSHLWRNFGILCAFWVFFNAVYAYATEYLSTSAQRGDMIKFKYTKHRTKENREKTTQQHAVEMHQYSQPQSRNPEIFCWQGVDYTIPIKGGTKKLLDDVTGFIKPGSLTALMGESGAGKTTLLNVLSQRISMGVVTGEMTVNGKVINNTFKRRTGYVQQQDIHFPTATVRESLQFAARLRRPASVPDAEKMAYVEKIIDLLGMQDFSDAYIGTVGAGLNVVQRKKVSIGVELVAKPSLLLFLDEPTSGLDSQSAWAVVRLLKTLAETGQAVLCTIHQPSATLFEQFDRLILLQRGGQTVYCGDTGVDSIKLTSYFEKRGSRECFDDENPAEYILECIGAGASGLESEIASADQQDWAQIWKQSDEYRHLQYQVKEICDTLRDMPQYEHDPSLHRTYAVGFWTQFRLVLTRTYTHYWRSPTYLISKLVMMVIVGLFTGFTFYKVDNSLTGMQNSMFAVFIIMVLAVPLSNQIQAHAIPTREVFEAREAQSNMYHWSFLLVAQFLAELPYHVVFSTMLFFCFYLPGGFRLAPPVAGMFYFTFAIMFQLYAISFSLWIGFLSPNAPSAAVLSSLFFSFMIQFCGVLQPKSLMHFWIFMYHVSPFTYFISSFLGVIFHGETVRCKPIELNVFQPPANQTCSQFAGQFVLEAGGYIADPDATSNCEYCRFSTGDQWLESLGISYGDRWRNTGIFCAYILFNIIMMVLCYWLLRIAKFKKPAFNIGAKKRPTDAAANEPVPGSPTKSYRHILPSQISAPLIFEDEQNSLVRTHTLAENSTAKPMWRLKPASQVNDNEI